MSTENKRQYLPWTMAGIVFLLLVWEAVARIYGSTLILPGPLPVLESFRSLIFSPRFFSALGNSFLRVLGGIAIAIPLGIIAGIAAGLDKRILAFLKPTFSVISATPVISVILILFLVLGSGRTPVVTAFLMVFPVITFNIIEGINSTNSRLKELFVSFRMSRSETLKYLYIPTLVPFILGGLRSSLALCWKVVVAAEVIVQPLRSLGAGMQHSKANLETPELFAWTAATVIAAALSQGALSLVIKRYKKGAKK